MTYIVSVDAKNNRKVDSTYITECGYNGSHSLSLTRQQFLFDIRSRYMMTTSHRRRIDKFHFPLLLKIEENEICPFFYDVMDNSIETLPYAITCSYGF